MVDKNIWKYGRPGGDKETPKSLSGHPHPITNYYSQQNKEQNKIITLSIENLEYELRLCQLEEI